MRTFDFDNHDYWIDPPTEREKLERFRGRNCFLYYGKLPKKMVELYPKNVALKILYTPLLKGQKAQNIMRSRRAGTVCESVKIQNVFAVYGLAPRIYDIVTLRKGGKRYVALVVEYLDRVNTMEESLVVREKLKKYDKYIQTYLDYNEFNCLEDKWVDFEEFYFKPTYKEHLIEKLDEFTVWDKIKNYQDIRGFYDGGRKTEQRIKEMGLDKIDFKGKTVLDIGCSGGEFCRYADDRGAKKVVGVDMENVVRVAEELSRFLGYHRIDFVARDLMRDDISLPKFDIVLFFSMGYHVNYRKYLNDLAREMVIFEGNCCNIDPVVIEGLKRDFKTFEITGKTTDLFNRPVGIARR